MNGDIPCADCGTNKNIIWFTDNVLWNDICRTKTTDAGILCVNCFVIRAEKKYDIRSWIPKSYAIHSLTSTTNIISNYYWVLIKFTITSFTLCYIHNLMSFKILRMFNMRLYNLFINFRSSNNF